MNNKRKMKKKINKTIKKKKKRKKADVYFQQPCLVGREGSHHAAKCRDKRRMWNEGRAGAQARRLECKPC
jgi:hypothetical protein